MNIPISSKTGWIKPKLIFITFIFILSTEVMHAQKASVSWDLTSSQKVSETIGPVIGHEEVISNMVVSSYSFLPGGLNGNSQITTIKGNYWPVETNQNNYRYIQFAVDVRPGITFKIDTISLYYTGMGGHYMNINIAYSTDSSFADSIQLNPPGVPITLSDNSPSLNLLTFIPNINLPYGKTLYLRIFPWYKLNATGKYVCLQDVIISGTTTGNVAPVPPIVSITQITKITTTTSVAGGMVILDGDAEVNDRGFCWNKTGFPTVNDSKVSCGSGLGTFEGTLNGLQNFTKYYVRSYATNSVGTGYSQEDSLITRSTLSIPEITTNDSIKVIGTSVICGGKIEDWGGSEILKEGICYNTTGNPDLNDNVSIDSSLNNEFTISIYHLKNNTTYYLRAFATNNIGTSYGTVKTVQIPVTLKGAYADGVHKDTKTIQADIDSCSNAGGGVVYLMNGIYYTAPFELKSNVTLFVDSTAKILASSNRYDYYPPGFDTSGGKNPSSLQPLITSNYADNITIEGSGTIDGNGKPWWDARKSAAPGTVDLRPWLIVLKYSNNVIVKDITLTNSPKFHLAPQWCHNVLIENVKIKAPSDSPNTDGIDPATCHNVRILNCWIDTGDDNVAIKSGSADPSDPNAGSSDILVSNCTFLHGHGVSIGSETNGGVDSMVVENCTFDGTSYGIRIKSNRTRGGNVRGLLYKNLTMNNVTYPIYFSEYYPDIPDQTDPVEPITSTTPYYHDITVKNLNATNCKYGGVIIGLPETPLKNITLDSISISAVTGLRIRNASVSISNTSIKVSSGSAFLLEKNGVITGIKNNEDEGIPEQFSLMQNFPNPFNPSTTIRYKIPKQSKVVLAIYDILGDLVTTLVNKVQPAGGYQVRFSAANYSLTSGVYFYRLQAGEKQVTKKFILLK